jgi:hypothetical protein
MQGKLYCVFCGNKIHSRYEDYQEYFECECDDARHNRKIRESIRGLEKQLIKPRFEIRNIVVPIAKGKIQ